MGEKRRERTSKRRKTAIRTGHSDQKSCSDSEVIQSRLKDRRAKSRDQLPWPRVIEAISVDELARYRRRRVPNTPRDTLSENYHKDCEDNYKNFVTEYRRSFRAVSEESRLCKRDFKHSNEFIGEKVGLAPPIDLSVVDGIEEKILDVEPMETDVKQLRPQYYEPIPIAKRADPKYIDEFYGNTEYSNYKAHVGYHKAQLIRRPTSLRMEGDMRGITEQCEKFIEWLDVKRPELARIPTNLKLEGHFETSTENHDQYVPFVGVRRPEILRQSAHLRLEGESNFNSEYTNVFKTHIFQEKRAPKLPKIHLKSGGEFIGKTENTQQFVDPRGTVPINYNDDFTVDDTQNQGEKEHMKMLVCKLEDLQAPPLETPEYKDAFKDFPRERPKLFKPKDEIGRADGSKVHLSLSPGKFPMKIDQDPEYKSKYLDKDRPVHRKSLTSSRRPSVDSSTYGRRRSSDLRQYNDTSEVRSQYIPYGNIPRIQSLKKPVTLRPEGGMNLQPEYRDAYCIKRDNYPSIDESINRNHDRRNSILKKHDNNWINNNNGEEFGMINPKYDQDAFRILHTKAHDDNIIGKPPLAIRRESRSLQPQRTHGDSNIGSSGMVKNRSPSPTYRLHVCNVDGEARGFRQRRRRSSSSHYKLSQSPPLDCEIHDDNQRVYSPSFGREPLKHQNDEDQAFVVLNNGTENNGIMENYSDDRFEKNINVEAINGEGRRRARNKTPTNWMPPWYDNTNTI